MSKKKDFLIYSGISASVGALTAFGLSFTNLSPLVVGGIIGTAFPALFMICYMGKLLYDICKEGEIEDDYKSELFFLGCVITVSAAVGAGIVAAASAYGITTGTVLAGAVIGMLSSIIGIFSALAIFTAVEEVSEDIESPVIEKVKERSSSQKLGEGL